VAGTATAFTIWLKTRRRELGLTQGALAEAVGCSAKTIEKIESGERKPSEQIAELLAASLGVPPGDLRAFAEFARGSLPVGELERLMRSDWRAPWHGLHQRPNNLPAPAAPFIGREGPIEEACALIRRPGVRLLTMSGPPGIGKTRLALQVALEVLGDFEDGAFFAALAPVSDPALVLSTIAQALKVRERAGVPLLDGVREHLAPKQLLLLLDNFEQVAAAGPLVGELLSAAPRLKVVVTSRQLLHIYGEYDLPVPPLSLPDPGARPPVDRLARYESLRLFAERAGAVRPDFRITGENAAAVAEICRGLDGLPLAIELAAARARDLAPDAILAKLGTRLDLLSGGPRDLPARQQTVRSAIDWSYDLLDGRERAVFRALSVFAGGCTLEAAASVGVRGWGLGVGASSEPPTSNPQPLTPILASLTGKSLLQQEGDRFTMLETIREYAWELLQASGEAQEARRRHAEYFLGLAGEAAPYLKGPQQNEWLDRLEVEHGNLRAALGWALEAGEIEVALKAGADLWLFWFMRGYMTEGRRWLEEALARSAGADGRLVSARARGLAVTGVLAQRQGDYAYARTLLEESVALWRDLGDPRGIAESLNNLGGVASEQGDYDLATSLYTESLALWRELGDTRSIGATLNNMGIIADARGDYERAVLLAQDSLRLFREVGDKSMTARVLNSLGETARARGDLRQATRFYSEGLDLLRELGDIRGVALILANLGQLALLRGDLATAQSLLEESLSIHQATGDRSSVTTCLAGLAGVALARDQAIRAAVLLGAAEALSDAIGYQLPPADRLQYDRDAAAIRARLGDTAWTAAWAEGRGMPLERAIAYALSSGGERGV
jgi:predicted ATPase/transcriptional regulator with XRE-family HTH domain/Flp pilus assembly protein TadD